MKINKANEIEGLGLLIFLNTRHNIIFFFTTAVFTCLVKVTVLFRFCVW